MRAVGDDEYLHVLVESAAAPEAVALVALDLVECLLDGDSAPLELDVHERQAVDQDGDVVAVVVGARLRVLVHDLQAVVVHVALVDELDVLDRAVVAVEHLHVVALDATRLLDDALVLGGDAALEEALPLLVSEGEAVEQLQLVAQVGDELVLGRERHVLVGLALQLGDERLLELGLALVGRGAPALLGCSSTDGGLAAERHDLEVHGRRQIVNKRLTGNAIGHFHYGIVDTANVLNVDMALRVSIVLDRYAGRAILAHD